VPIRRVFGAALATWFAVTSSGCFTYATVDPGAVTPGRDVRMELTDAGTAALAPLIGPGMVTVDGRVTSVDSGEVQLAVTQTTDRRSIEHLWRGEPVTVPRPLVSHVSQRKFSASRTALLSAGIAAAVVAAAAGAHAASSSSSPGGSGHGGG
jgi:hypothetical protein